MAYRFPWGQGVAYRVPGVPVVPGSPGSPGGPRGPGGQVIQVVPVVQVVQVVHWTMSKWSNGSKWTLSGPFDFSWSKLSNY